MIINLRGWPHRCFRVQGWSQSGGFDPHAIGGYKTVAPQLHDSSSKPVKIKYNHS